MTSSSCPNCGQSIEDATAHTCAANAASAAAPAAESASDSQTQPSSVPPASPYVPSMDGTATSDSESGEPAGAPGDSAAGDSPPPMPPYAPDGWAEYPPGMLEPRYISKVVWINALWGFLSGIGVAVVTFGIGLLIAIIVVPIVCGIQISKAPDARIRSRAMGWMLGVLATPVVAFGICLVAIGAGG